MKASAGKGRIIVLSILAGLIAGGILAGINLYVVQPSTNALVGGIIDELMADGEFDEEEFDSQARNAYLTQTVGSAAIGIAAGALIGCASVYGKRNAGIADALLIAGIAWFVLSAVPAAKYPPSPIAMFSGEAAAEYYQLYISYLVVSGLAALGVAFGFGRMTGRNKVFGMAAAYLVVIAIAYFVFPPYELDSTFDQSLLNPWRALVSASAAAFWFSAGAIAGIFWKYGSVRR
jgi:hypothetical protein